MVSRRQVLIGGGMVGAGAAWAQAPVHAAQRIADRRLSLFLFDRSLPGATAAADFMMRAGVPVAGFAGDVGVPWLEILAPAWRQAPRTVAGFTGDGALFCLEQLGANHGLTCTYWLADPLSRTNRFDTAGGSLLRAAASGRPRRGSSAERTGGPVAWLLHPLARSHV